LESISKMPEPKLAEVKNEEKALSELKDKLLQRTQERATEIDNQRSNALSTLPNKSELVEEIMPGFESNRAAIETDSGLDESFKKDMIVQLEEALQQKAEQRLEEVEDALGSNSTDVSLNKEKQLLAEIIAESKNRVKENQLENLISSKERELLIGELFPDYESRKEQLSISKMEESKKIDAQLKLENELLTKLQAEVKLVQKQLDKNPSDETLIKRLNALNLLIDEQQTRISELNQRKIGFASAEIAENAIRSADKTYAEDVKKIEAQVDGPEKQEALANREALLQKNLNEQIEANTKQLDKKSDPELETANQALKQELINSEERESNYKEVTPDPIADNKKEEAYIENLREDLLSGNATELSAQRNELSELKKQDEILAQYELDLKTEIKAVENELSEKSGDTQLKEELQWLKQELATVQAKRREVNITIGELETELISANSTEKKITSPELEKLEQEERALEQQLKNQDLSTAERKNVEKELAVNRSEQVETENKVLEAFVEEKNNALTNELKQLNQSTKGAEDPEVRLVEKQVVAELNEVAELVNAAEKTKNETEKNYLLNEAVEKQETAEAIVENAIYEQELKRIEEEYGLTSLDSKEELEKKKRRYTIEVGELTTEIELLNNEIATADKKEVTVLTKEKSDKTTERILVQEQLSGVEKALAALPKENSTLSEESKDVVLSFNEERDLASTKEYANYVEKVNEALRVEQQIINLEKQLNEAKAQTKALVADNLEQQTPESKAALEVSANKVKQIETELAIAKSELAQKQELANEELPQNTDEAMKMQNLVRRGVAPINKLLIAAALVPMPANGLDINADGPGTYSEANRIPVNVTSPQGLVYRVQIGAFAKPIEQNRFKEFTPVSGETLNNGITRYMAGYFNNSNKVLQAMNQIRALGYADAFPVAYCDGKRISLAEARRLEATGECVPKGTNELMMEIAANTAVTMGLEDTTKLRKVPEFTYNQAPGAAKAEPIEMRKGLFFTVQIGVYNKPVPSATLFNLEPYMTIRLPNGQIRYSTGIYHSIDEARPRKQEAINRGVKDAFITAYFNGERIPINDALKMLEERGTSILEPKEKPNEADTTTNNMAVNNPVIYEKTESPVELPKKPKVFMQIVTKKQFETFPVEVLNRYNSHGSFYYDENDKRVKSSITNSDDNLPQVYYFREDIDTVRYLSSSEFMQGTILSLTFAEGKLPGDVVDWLLRQNYRKEYLQSEEGVTMLIHGVPEEKFSQMESELAVFGMSFTKVAPKEEEVENNK
jgi:epidermal growth factor receptor substrate 15